jgi:hypothetical protein
METPKPSRRSQIGLDLLNFFMADVETAFGRLPGVHRRRLTAACLFSALRGGDGR